jgi:single-strand DNA-binding protein
MASVNLVILMGNAGKDPVMKTWPDGNKQAQFSIATSEQWKDKTTGEKKEKTEWHNVVCNGPLAGIVEKYVKKGTSVHITGKITQRSWDDPSGQKKCITEIVANQLQLCGSKPSESGQASSGSSQQSSPVQSQNQNYNDDDLPF